MDEQKILADIADAIRLKVEAELELPHLPLNGLCSGSFGFLLFLSRYRHHAADRDRYERLHAAYLEKCLHELACGRLTLPTFCNGLSGALALLKKEYAGEIDLSDANPVFDKYLLGMFRRYLADHNWDFLHGALGIGLYFLMDDDKAFIQTELLDYLEQTSLLEDGCRKIRCRSTPSGWEYNISLSHGISSLVVYLSALYRKRPSARVERLLTEFVGYVVGQQIDFDTYGSCFPRLSIEQQPSLTGSRLAWCYGDLGVACALYQAALALQNAEWKRVALAVFDKNTTRRDLAQNGVKDACICHGTSGIALIFWEMYKQELNPAYKACADYWLGQTVGMSRFADGPAGFKSFMPTAGSAKAYVAEYDLLEGVAGIGLVMLTCLYDETWSDLLLIR